MNFPGKNIMFLMVMGTMMIPFQVIMVPLYIEIFKFGLINTYPGLVLPRATNAFGIFMMRSFFISLPKGWKKPDGLTAARNSGFLGKSWFRCANRPLYPCSYFILCISGTTYCIRCS